MVDSKKNTPIGTFIASKKSIGFDGLLNYYAKREELDITFENEFKKQVNWNPQLGNPYVAVCRYEIVRTDCTR